MARARLLARRQRSRHPSRRWSTAHLRALSSVSRQCPKTAQTRQKLTGMGTTGHRGKTGVPHPDGDLPRDPQSDRIEDLTGRRRTALIRLRAVHETGGHDALSLYDHGTFSSSPSVLLLGLLLVTAASLSMMSNLPSMTVAKATGSGSVDVVELLPLGR